MDKEIIYDDRFKRELMQYENQNSRYTSQPPY